MRHTFSLLLLTASSVAAADVTFPKFNAQEIATDLTVGYGVIVADINEDQKPDIVVVDSKRVIWYENPTWQVRTVIAGKTKPDNVCIAAHDIDGDGHLDLVLGADWNPSNTKTGGTLQWLKRGKTLDEEWSVHPIAEEPTVHRVRVVADLGLRPGPSIILAPLHGREATAKGNWTDGRPVRILAFPIPADPVRGPWKPVVMSEELRVVHNIWPHAPRLGGVSILTASYEGVSVIAQRGDQWATTQIGAGNQANPKGPRGASEVKAGALKGDRSYIATIEPWHGNEVVVYTVPDRGPGIGATWERTVVDDHLRWGHAVWCANLDGDEVEELIIGVRDNPAKGDKFTEKRGVRIYKATDGAGKKWERMLLDEDGVAVEDLTAADLNGDGKIDIVAVGRATRNAKIYWNQGK